MLAPAIWAGLGFQIVIFMAGLRAIPTTYYEAARIDGVSRLDDPARDHPAAAEADHRLPRRVLLDRLPAHLRPGLQHDHDGDPGGPLNATKPLVLMIYQTAFSSFDMGYAAAQTVVLFLVLLVVSLLQLCAC